MKEKGMSGLHFCFFILFLGWETFLAAVTSSAQLMRSRCQLLHVVAGFVSVQDMKKEKSEWRILRLDWHSRMDVSFFVRVSISVWGAPENYCRFWVAGVAIEIPKQQWHFETVARKAGPNWTAVPELVTALPTTRGTFVWKANHSSNHQVQNTRSPVHDIFPTKWICFASPRHSWVWNIHPVVAKQHILLCKICWKSLGCNNVNPHKATETHFVKHIWRSAD